VGFHQHDGVELVLVTRGTARVAVDGLDLRAGPGELFVLPGRTPHDQRNDGEVETWYASLALPPRALDQRARVLSLPDHQRVQGWMASLADLVWRDHPACSGLALAVVETLAEAQRQARSDTARHPALVRAIHHLEADLLEPLSAADVAAAAGVSTSHCGALFKAAFGCGILAYRQRLRLALAARLLADPYLPVAEVGRACGYGDPNLFSRRFRAHHRCSPSTWRRRALRNSTVGSRPSTSP
jgi:AraC-like DNA-binding protein